ncbi:MAG: asparagine synthase (glutamine-hydrolyzing) [Nitratireductor sp.]
MCGIAGYAGIDDPGLIGRMCAALVHRGPDSGGSAAFPEAGFHIGMRRLAVIDLETGDQPMFAAEGRVGLVHNGEIYNYREVRHELLALGHDFVTTSDTEVVLKAYLAWGEKAWSRLHGMFAIAVADLRDGMPVLKVVRDRVGIKPLYYAVDADRFLFASEIKALMAWDGFDRTVDLAAVTDYFTLRYVPGPRSMFRGVQKLPPGHELVFSGGQAHLRRYWSPPGPGVQIADRDPADAVADFGEAMRASVHRHMISDVPVGAFLSGGVDSNTIVALMAEQSGEPVRTFSIGFAGHPDADLRRAAATAQMIGARHTEIECGIEDFLSLPDICWSLDEPLGDAIVVPMSVLAREARKEVTVVLSGEGADELLGGYLFHRKIVDLWRWRDRLPRPAWPLASALIERLPVTFLDRAFDYPGKLGSAGRSKIADLVRQTGSGNLAELYRASISLFDAKDILQVAGSALPMPAPLAAPPDNGTVLQRLLGLQYAHWLPDDILMKSDKITMAHSLECRVPFMDDLVIQAAARCADDVKLRGGKNKWALRRFGETLLGPEAAAEPKRAFYAPLDQFMRDRRFRDMLRGMLDPERLKRRGLVDHRYVARLQGAGEDDGFLSEKRLFAIFMLELWFEKFAPDASWA